jgi:hypothetical protein
MGATQLVDTVMVPRAIASVTQNKIELEHYSPENQRAALPCYKKAKRAPVNRRGEET